jgi:hypothetical protein
MADDKDKGKGKPTLSYFEQVVLFLIIIYFVGIFWYRTDDFVTYYANSSYDSLWAALVAYFYNNIVPIYKVIAFIVSALCIWGIVHAHGVLTAINKEEKAIYGMKSPVEDDEAPVMKNEKWERVITHLNSVNSADWRLAVIEADIMLDELLKTLGYIGESLGDRLKAVEKSDMLTLDNAWDAHRIRNQIAHQGADFPLSEREAKRAIALYESVFKEYKII